MQSPLHAQTVECSNTADDKARLACYDKQYGAKGAATPPAALIAPAAIGAKVASGNTDNATGLLVDESSTQKTPLPARENKILIKRRAEVQATVGRTLIEDWDLDPKSGRAPFELWAYKPMYVMLGTHTTNVNRQPSSSQAQNSAVAPQPLNATEAQFQISFKSKVWDNIVGNNGSLWFGYTQSSRWQIYTGALSRPFRETNYEPEATLVFRTPYEIAGLQGRMTSISVVHQSNGRSLPLSRSWNRVVAQLGMEKGDWMLLVRPWWRIPEKNRVDDNPGIENYVGRGEVIIAKRYGSHVFSLQARHSLRSGAGSRGSAKLEWSLPLSGYLKGHFHVFSGYGESLVDFNHRQTIIGLGISLVEWR